MRPALNFAPRRPLRGGLSELERAAGVLASFEWMVSVGLRFRGFRCRGFVEGLDTARGAVESPCPPGISPFNPGRLLGFLLPSLGLGSRGSSGALEV